MRHPEPEPKCRQRNSRPSRPLERAAWPNDGTRKRLSDGPGFPTPPQPATAVRRARPSPSLRGRDGDCFDTWCSEACTVVLEACGGLRVA